MSLRYLDITWIYAHATIILVVLLNVRSSTGIRVNNFVCTVLHRTAVLQICRTVLHGAALKIV